MTGAGPRQGKLELDAARPAAPFVKWAGGKSRLLGQLEPLLPAASARHLEPFVGGGAVFFYLHNVRRIPHGALLSDLNPELINCYRVVQDERALPGLLDRLHSHQRHVMEKDYYYQLRAQDREPGFPARGPIERAARTIFLNHTCYNGLYRLNSKGQFNVPYGKWTRPPRIFDEENLWACHRALRGAELREESFETCLERARKGDFVYLDPPYHPLSRTSSFTTYTGSEFREKDQRRLAETFRALDARGCLVMLSNSAAPLIRRLYRGFRVETVQAARAISCRGTGRGKIDELVVLNY